MIGVLTHHWAKADKIDEARNLLGSQWRGTEQGSRLRAAATPSSRSADPAKITTLVVWTSNDIYDAWRASPQRAAAMSGADQLWAKPPESERFQIVN